MTKKVKIFLANIFSQILGFLGGRLDDGDGGVDGEGPEDQQQGRRPGKLGKGNARWPGSLKLPN